MIEPWELILHHSYSGTPGVAFDHSPRHAAHGRAVDLDAADFNLDGRTDGSGAVRFRRTGRIAVAPTGGFDHLGALSAEVVFQYRGANAGGQLISAHKSFLVGIFGDGSLELGVTTNWHAPGSQLGELRFSASLEDFDIRPGSWVQAGYVYDGIGRAQLFLNGASVKSWIDRPLQPVRPVAQLTIGNERGGSLPFSGLIDDVKIWRPNPHRITHDFLVRILDGGVSQCWLVWGKAFRAALDGLANADVECAGTLFRLVNQAQAALAVAIGHSAATRQAWQETVAEYQRLWNRGEVAAIGPVLSRLLDTFRADGVPLDQVAAVRELIDSHCFQDLVRRVPPPDCDPEFTAMFSGQGS